MVSSPGKGFRWELRGQQVSGDWTVPLPLPKLSLLSYGLSSFSHSTPCHEGRVQDSGSTQSHCQTWMKQAGCVLVLWASIQTIPFFFPGQPLTGSLLERVGVWGRDSAWSQWDSQQNINLALDIYCLVAREKEEVGVCPRAGVGTLTGDSEMYLESQGGHDLLTQLFCFSLRHECSTVTLILWQWKWKEPMSLRWGSGNKHMVSSHCGILHRSHQQWTRCACMDIDLQTKCWVRKKQAEKLHLYDNNS